MPTKFNVGLLWEIMIIELMSMLEIVYRESWEIQQLIHYVSITAIYSILQFRILQ